MRTRVIGARTWRSTSHTGQESGAHSSGSAFPGGRQGRHGHFFLLLHLGLREASMPHRPHKMGSAMAPHLEAIARPFRSTMDAIRETPSLWRGT